MTATRSWLAAMPQTALRPATAHGLVGGGPAAGGTMESVDLTVEQQIGDFTCWAAVAASVAQRHNRRGSPAWQQCEIVASQIGGCQDCCASAKLPDGCDQPWYLEKALVLTGNFKLSDSLIRTPPELQTELRATNPVCIAIKWPGDTYHFIAVVTVDTRPADKPKIVVSDPLYGFWTGTYGQLLSGYHNVTTEWAATYLVI